MVSSSLKLVSMQISTVQTCQYSHETKEETPNLSSYHLNHSCTVYSLRIQTCAPYSHAQATPHAVYSQVSGPNLFSALHFLRTEQVAYKAHPSPSQASLLPPTSATSLARALPSPTDLHQSRTVSFFSCLVKVSHDGKGARGESLRQWSDDG